MIHFHIITLFPESIEPYLSASILGRAQKDGTIKVSFYNPRDFTKDRHRRVDQKPYGGGPGMVLEVASFVKATEKAIGRKKNVFTIVLAADGEQFTSTLAKHWAKTHKHIIFICGHYEGLDARIAKVLKAKKLSIGPYILTGGELPAAIIIDAVARHVPGVLGDYQSLEDERISSSEVYTRPEVFMHKGKKHRVPSVLLSGHHAQIDAWKSKRRKH